MPTPVLPSKFNWLQFAVTVISAVIAALTAQNAVVPAVKSFLGP